MVVSKGFSSLHIFLVGRWHWGGGGVPLNFHDFFLVPWLFLTNLFVKFRCLVVVEVGGITLWDQLT